MNIPAERPFAQTADAGLLGRKAHAVYTGDDEANETVTMDGTVRSYSLITDATYTLTMTLPKVSEHAGMMFFFKLITDGGQDVTITDAGDDPDFGDITMDTVNDAFILVSDGRHWFAMNAIATT